MFDGAQFLSILISSGRKSDCVDRILKDSKEKCLFATKKHGQNKGSSRRSMIECCVLGVADDVERGIQKQSVEREDNQMMLDTKSEQK